MIRHLYHEAAKSQKYGGLSDNEALSLITINPAIQLGIDDRVGSLEKGKYANFLITSDNILNENSIESHIMHGQHRTQTRRYSRLSLMMPLCFQLKLIM